MSAHPSARLARCSRTSKRGRDGNLPPHSRLDIPVSADVGVRAAPRPSSDSSDTDPIKASSLREAQPRSTQTGSYRNGQLIVDAQPREIKPRAVAFDGPGAALDPDYVGSLVYGETQVDPKARLPIQARIIGGEEVNPPGKYPWMLGVVAVSSSGSESFRCGATLITSRYALSASHCFFSAAQTPTWAQAPFH